MTSDPLEFPEVDALAVFPGPVLVLAPHSDDETLGCGGVIAQLSARTDVHVIYATDGRRSPIGPDGAPALDWGILTAARRDEARQAMELLGVPAQNLHFLDLPDGELAAAQRRLESALVNLVAHLRPETVFVPFRHDQHPDHLAAHRAATRVLAGAPKIRLAQYFVYYRYPLLHDPDIRRAVDPRHCVRIDIGPQRAAKRRALELYISQTTCRYPWQTRPVLSTGLLDEHCDGCETFVMIREGLPDHELFREWSVRFRLGLRFGPQAVRLKKRFLG